jgi:hypothetical protein
VAGGGFSGAVAGAGVVLLGIALMVWMLGWLFRMSIASNRDRELEEAAREHFTRTGRWPGEDEEPAGTGSPASSAGAEPPDRDDS